jgi:hypothetical protein
MTVVEPERPAPAPHAVGEPAVGSFRCAICRYGVVVRGALPPRRPMCGGGLWEEARERRRPRASAPARADRDYTSGVAEPLRSPADDEELPSLDPGAIDRAYRRERARRRARLERQRARRLAGVRFWLVLLALVAVSVLLDVTVWRQMEQLFGL